MARKPEATYRNSVHKHINKKHVYFASMGGAYVAGVPDVYYEGNAGCIWVEWKNFQNLPNLISLSNKSSASKLSALQQSWLRRAAMNGVKTAVICGSPDGGIIFNGISWDGPMTREDFTISALSRAEIAAWITTQVHKEET